MSLYKLPHGLIVLFRTSLAPSRLYHGSWKYMLTHSAQVRSPSAEILLTMHICLDNRIWILASIPPGLQHFVDKYWANSLFPKKIAN